MINSDQLALMKTAQLRKKKAGIEYICYFRQRYIQIFQSCSRNLSGSHAQVRQPWERSLTQCRTPISWFWDGAPRPRASLRDETECWEQATSDRLSLLRKSDKTNSSQEFLCGTDFWLALNWNNTKRPEQKYQRARFEPRVWQRRGMWKILLVRPLVESNNWTRKWRAATRSYGVTLLITIFRKTLN